EAPGAGPHPMIGLLARVRGVGIATAELLVREALSRHLRDRRAVARYAGLTGAPDESGSKRREQGLAKAGNARIRRPLTQPASRSFAADADDCIMVDPAPGSPNTRLLRKPAARWRAPLRSARQCVPRHNRGPDPPSLAPCSPPSRPLRAACGGGLRPVLTAA